MNSRTWLAISLACLIWFSYLKWFAPVPAHQVQTPTTETAQTKTEEAKPTTVAPTQLEVSSQLYKVSNTDFELGFSAKGGRIADVELKKYKTSIKKDAELIRTVSSGVNGATLATLFSESSLSALNNADYALEGKGNNLKAVASGVSGAKVTKEYTVIDSGFTIDSTVTIQAPKDSKKNLGYLSIPLGGHDLQYAHEEPLKAWEIVYLQDEKVHRTNWDSLPETEEIKQGATSWLAFGNRYFATSVVNESEINPDIVLTRKKDFTGAYLRYPIVFKEGQNTVTYKFKIYTGPKVVAELSKIPGLKQLVDYGMFSFFAYPLLETLRFFYKFIHNYGIAIILLTLLVRILFYPLSIKSYKSMKAMQKLQPQIAQLKVKYKDDMTRMNQEQMALFKAHNVNPMGGCFPMLVQLPVFIALYAVLGNSIELFQAPFFGWVQDLSTKDPFYIYPVLMGIAMFLQQKMTPAAGMDPAQQKMMLFMPVIFSFMMISLPAGLTLYIFVSTLLGIVQQWSMMRDPKPNSPLAVVEASSKTK